MTANHVRINGKSNGNGKANGNGNGSSYVNGSNGIKGVEILAKTLFRDLKNSGYDLPQILDFSGKLIGFVYEEINAPEDTEKT